MYATVDRQAIRTYHDQLAQALSLVAIVMSVTLVTNRSKAYILSDPIYSYLKTIFKFIFMHLFLSFDNYIFVIVMFRCFCGIPYMII